MFAETANFKATADVVDAAALGRFVDALHANEVQVVGWYLPGFDKPGRDLRRARAMLTFRTLTGAGFDAVALDVEATVEKRVAAAYAAAAQPHEDADRGGGRDASRRDHPAATDARAATDGGGLVSPGGDWPGLVDAFVPMAYTGSAFRGYEATYGYVARSLASLEAAIAGVETSVHAAGGVADRMSAEELRAFVDAVTDAGTSSG